MEVGNTAARQRCVRFSKTYIPLALLPLTLESTIHSVLTSANHSDHYDPRHRDPRDRLYREGPTMATATLLNPTSHYQSQPPSYSSNYSHSHSHSHPATSSMPGIISPGEPRRTIDDNEPHRQSLPSIQEVIGSKPPTSAYPPSISTAVSGTPSLPSPFASSTSRPFADLSSPQDNKHPSPRSLHNPTSFPARGDPMPPFSDPSRPSLSSRPPPPPPVNTYHQNVRPSPPPLKMEPHAAERPGDAHRNSGVYPHSAVSEPAGLPYPQSGHLPPGQLPLSAHPMSPRYSTGPSLPSPFDGSRSSIHEDADYIRRDNKYEQTLNRHFEAWQYQESLAKVSL